MAKAPQKKNIGVGLKEKRKPIREVIEDSKYWRMLHILNKDERTAWDHYIRSPLVTERKQLEILQRRLNFLKESSSGEGKTDITDSEILNFLAQEGEDGTSMTNLSKANYLKKLLSDLSLFLEECILFLERRKEAKLLGPKPDLRLGNWFHSKGLDKYYQQHLSDAQKYFGEDGQAKDFADFINEFQYVKLRYYGELNRGSSNAPMPYDLVPMQIAYVVECLRQRTEQLVQAGVLNRKDTSKLLDPVTMQLLTDAKLESQPIIRAFHIVYQLFSEFNERQERNRLGIDPSLEELFNLLSAKPCRISLTDSQFLMNQATNYCIRVNNTHRGPDFEKIAIRHFAHKIYQFRYERKDFDRSDFQFSHLHLRNIVQNACHIEGFGWAKDFLLEHLPKVEAEMLEVSRHFNNGVIEYSSGNYEAAIDEFSLVTDRDPLYSIWKRFFLVKAKWDSDHVEDDDVHTEIERLIQYLKRESILDPSRIKKFLKRARLMSQILNASTNPGKLTKLSEKVLKGEAQDINYLLGKISVYLGWI